MWVYSHALQDWRYYLVTSLVDTLGRRKTYGLLIDAFERIELPPEMTVEDVHLGSPNDPFFRLISSTVSADDVVVHIEGCVFNGVSFDGAIYRSVREPPSVGEAKQIERRFSKRVKELVADDH